MMIETTIIFYIDSVCSILRLIDEEIHQTVSNKNIIVRIHWWFLLYSYQLLLDIFDMQWRI